MPATTNRSYVYPSGTSPATVPSDMQVFLAQIDADVQELRDRVEAREQIVVTHSGNGVWAVTDGLGEPVPVNDLGDGLYQIGA